jgi:hypothetical protein
MLRIPYPGAVCHVPNRCDRRGAIFAGDKDRRRYMETLERRHKGDPRKGATRLGMAKPDDETLKARQYHDPHDPYEPTPLVIFTFPE